MQRSLGCWVAATVVAAGAFVACGDETSEGSGNAVTSAGGADAGGNANGGAPGSGGSMPDGGGAAPAAGCLGECCPEAAQCYSDPALGAGSPGAECLARRDNPREGGKIQMRQTWLRSRIVYSATGDLQYGALNRYTQLDEPSCYSRGESGFIQLLELDLGNPNPSQGALQGTLNHVSRLGYAKYVPAAAVPTALSQGLCMVEQVLPAPGTEAEDTWALDDDEMSPTNGWHPALPRPMGRKTTPWHVEPTHAVRLVQDFDLATDRTEILDQLHPTTGALGRAGYNGVFHYDPATGRVHGFGLIAYQVVYDTATTYIVIPMREVETRSVFNDPEHPSCVGEFRSRELDPDNGCLPDTFDQVNPAWGCASGSCPAGEGPATTEGYFLITELEQIYGPGHGSTLCYSYPGGAASNAAGWGSETSKFCRSSPAWNPSDPTNGLPQGDWCAATNSEATRDCHDAYRSNSFQTFQGFHIQEGTCAAVD